MIKLTIYGRLRKFIGQSTFEIDVASPRQAFSFLVNNFDGVADHIKTQEYCVMAGKVRITEDLLDLQTESDIKIIPVVHGEIRLGRLFKIGLGVAAVALGGGATVLGLTVGVKVQAAFTAIGASLLLQGVSDLLFPPPTPPTFGGADEQDPSFTFDGTTNISKQGVPINIVYGETLIGTNTISANVDTLQVVNN
jgi:predicted phage tail protein